MKIEATSITLDRAELSALLLSASTDATRINLCNVHIEPAACVAVTTDGHRLTLATASGVRHAGARAVNVPAAMLRAAVKAAKVGDAIAVAWGDDGECTATVGTMHGCGDFMPGGMVIRGELARGDAFPPWRAVFPTALHPAAVPVALNPLYLADVLVAIAKLLGKSGAVTCWGPAKGEARRDTTADQAASISPVVFAAHDSDRGCDWRIVVMPMRHDHAAWSIAPETPAAVAGPAIVADGKRGRKAA